MSVNWPTTDSTIADAKLAPAVDDHTEANLIPPTIGLTHAYANSIARDMPMTSVTPSGGKFLSLLTTISDSRQVLEIGTLGGYSTIWFANALQRNGGGKVTSMEIDPERRQVAISNLKYAGFKVPEEAEVVLGAALDVLPKLAKMITNGAQKPFDFVFVDADWANHWAYFDWGVKLSKGKGAVIYVNNVVGKTIKAGIVGDDKRDDEAVDVLEMVGKDMRVESVVMQTIGAKDYDGFLMAVVN